MKGGKEMLNQIVLVGRLTDDPKLAETDTGKKKTIINLAVARPFKNSEGVYETDFIRCILWNGIADNAKEYTKKGDIVGIKGRLQTSTYEENGERKYMTEVIAERLSFITSYKKEEESD